MGSDAREVVIRQLFDAINSQRFDDIRALLNDKMAFHAPYQTGDEPTVAGAEPVVEFFSKALGGFFSSISFTVDKVRLVEGGNDAVVEYRSNGTIRRSGAPYTNRYAGIFETVPLGSDAGRQVSLWREYFDPMELERSKAWQAPST